MKTSKSHDVTNNKEAYTSSAQILNPCQHHKTSTSQSLSTQYSFT